MWLGSIANHLTTSPKLTPLLQMDKLDKKLDVVLELLMGRAAASAVTSG